MESSLETSSICQIRACVRENLSSQRKNGIYFLLKQRRLNLSDVENSIKDLSLEEFKVLASDIRHKKRSLESLKKLKNYSCSYNFIENFFKVNGAFDSLISILLGKNHSQQLEAAACLGNLSCGSHKASHRVARAAGAYLVSFIPGGSHFLQSQSAWTAGNIAGDCSECFSILKSQGLLPALLTAITSSSSEVIESAIYALSFCTRYEIPDELIIPESDFIRKVLSILEDTKLSEISHTYAGLTLANVLCTSIKEDIPDVNKNVVDAILSLINNLYKKDEVNVPVIITLIRCLGHLSISDLICDYLAQHDLFHTFLNCVIKGESFHLKREILWVLTNLATSSFAFCHLLEADMDTMFNIVSVLLNPIDTHVLQMLYFMCILSSKSDKICAFLHEKGTVSHVTSFLKCNNSNLVTASNVFLQIVSR